MRCEAQIGEGKKGIKQKREIRILEERDFVKEKTWTKLRIYGMVSESGTRVFR